MTHRGDPVNPPTCECSGETLLIKTRPDPTHIMLVWRGSEVPSVSKWLCWDAAAAYMHAEHMAGLRNGDTVILYALNWQAYWSGRA